jgi:predicted AlkP superfamily pyrophosphatase or phosphodiesterase
MAHRRWVTTAVALVVSVALGRTAPADGVAGATRATTQPHRPTARHVVLIGLDGARADAVRDHAGPALRSLIDAGTSCWNVEAVRPSVTQVNWASILTGRRPEAHGIDRHPVTEDELRGVRVKVPTLFELVAATGRPTAGFLGHWKLYPNETAAPGAHVVRSPYEAARVAPVAAAYVARERPAFCFVYLGDLDGLGHRHGWMSDEYLRGLAADVDAGIGTILDALDVAGIRDETVVLVTSDHGGHGKGHSQGTAEDLLVPWVAAGPGVRRGHVIRGPASTLDTAPTILRALGVAVPSRCDGSPLVEAFETPPASPITR